MSNQKVRKNSKPVNGFCVVRIIEEEVDFDEMDLSHIKKSDECVGELISLDPDIPHLKAKQGDYVLVPRRFGAPYEVEGEDYKVHVIKYENIMLYWPNDKNSV